MAHEHSRGGGDRAAQDWRPTAPLTIIARRAELLRQLRQFFDDRGFLEVETPLLSRDTVVDRYLDPLPVPDVSHSRRLLPAPAFLQTSPEFHMKRLLAAGAEAIYQVTRAFRGGEIGPRHNPEFTMAEWYRVGDDLEQATSLLADLAQHLLQRDRPPQVTYRALFLDHLGVDPHSASGPALQQIAHSSGVSAPATLAAETDLAARGDAAADTSLRDQWCDLLLTQCIEPRLAGKSVIVTDYPASQSALARVERDQQGVPVAKRFELLVDGIELANGYWELLDPRELRRRNRTVNQQRQDDGNSQLPTESRLLAAMEAGLPPSCGVALGFDRLVMCAVGATRLQDVMPFPWPRHA